ncbi:hypothetical protein D3C76_1849560 [compost metagenome]
MTGLDDVADLNPFLVALQMRIVMISVTQIPNPDPPAAIRIPALRLDDAVTDAADRHAIGSE